MAVPCVAYRIVPAGAAAPQVSDQNRQASRWNSIDRFLEQRALEADGSRHLLGFTITRLISRPSASATLRSPFVEPVKLVRLTSDRCTRAARPPGSQGWVQT